MGDIIKFVRRRRRRRVPQPGMVSGRHWAMVGLLGVAVACYRAADAGLLSLPTFRALNCAIKGNISPSGERIYHVSGQKNYYATIINRWKGERWFCTEADARPAGWRRARI